MTEAALPPETVRSKLIGVGLLVALLVGAGSISRLTSANTGPCGVSESIPDRTRLATQVIHDDRDAFYLDLDGDGLPDKADSWLPRWGYEDVEPPFGTIIEFGSGDSMTNIDNSGRLESAEAVQLVGADRPVLLGLWSGSRMEWAAVLDLEGCQLNHLGPERVDLRGKDVRRCLRQTDDGAILTLMARSAEASDQLVSAKRAWYAQSFVMADGQLQETKLVDHQFGVGAGELDPDCVRLQRWSV